MSFALQMSCFFYCFVVDILFEVVNAESVHPYLLRMQMILFPQLNIIFLTFWQINSITRRSNHYLYKREK